ncbi:ABC transporter permease [Caenibacillus caldisaponilyticus]|uniref:ABC transporter permease n=1 Tax=Caenibacillus caldisaponilyticus TaxID=1674942 RepID=UPI0009886584|nr:ABC transporter permease [Caenibacillus caldisaponilyticus]
MGTERPLVQEAVQPHGERAAEAQHIRQKLNEIWILFRIQFAEIRESWIWIFFMASMFPFSTLLFLKFYTVNPTPEAMIRIIVGNMVFAVIVMGINALAQEISWQKHQGHFVYYASLPISKLNFVLAVFLRGFLTSFPSVVIIAAIGQLIYGIHFHYSFGLIPVFLLSMLACVGIGTMIGFVSPNHQFTNLLAQTLLMVISFLSPVMVTMEMLPKMLQWLSYLFPTTYVANAFRDLFIHGWTHAVTVNTAVLSGYVILSFLVIYRFVEWRVER